MDNKDLVISGNAIPSYTQIHGTAFSNMVKAYTCIQPDWTNRFNFFILQLLYAVSVKIALK